MMEHKRIIVVDDEPMILEELCELLDTMEFDCVCAGSVDEALAIIAADNDITLVITDMRMPGRDGIDLISELAGQSDREFEYVVISGHLDIDAEMSGLGALPVKRLRKPVNLEEVMELLEQLQFAS